MANFSLAFILRGCCGLHPSHRTQVVKPRSEPKLRLKRPAADRYVRCRTFAGRMIRHGKEVRLLGRFGFARIRSRLHRHGLPPARVLAVLQGVRYSRLHASAVVAFGCALLECRELNPRCS
ncbi:hypothetical protein DAI22_03g078750 [Oryza sativa Japonica Group]|nr:hypothetical protein DAI22_03g078750 [Oryza sativa Japonica Group]